MLGSVSLLRQIAHVSVQMSHDHIAHAFHFLITKRSGFAAELAEAVVELCGGRRVPLFVGYNLQRGAELVDAFASFDLRDTGDVLGYATGVMEGRISLFTNWRP